MTIPTSLRPELSASVHGTTTYLEDGGWDAARQAYALSVDQAPAAVVHPESIDDIVAVVNFARTHGLRVAPQRTGHNAAPVGDLSRSILLRTDRLNQVEIDPAAQTARVQAGAQWLDVIPAAAAHGLATLAGSAADVGVIGYTLGGGVSWHARSLGLAANSVLSAKIVTADGVLRTVDATHEPDLFWALRGGGGSLGVVVELEFRLFPITEVFAGALFWPEEQADRVLRAWREWTTTLPDSVTSIGRVLRVPPFPDVPAPLRGRGFVMVEASMLLDAEAGAEILAPLRELQPEIDTFGTIPVSALAGLHMDPPDPVPGVGHGCLLSSLDDAAISALVTAITGPGAPLLSVELRHLGGALAPGASEGGAISGFDAEYLLFAVGIGPFPEAVIAADAAVDAVLASVSHVNATTTYLSFSERRTEQSALFGGSLERLARVKRTFDADDLFHANHGITPATI